MTIVHRCANPAQWHPTLHTHQDHHHPPLSWRRQILNVDPNADTSWWRIIPFCGLCHDEYHTLLDLHVRHGAIPPHALTKTFSVFIRPLVSETWRHRPPRPNYTLPPR